MRFIKKKKTNSLRICEDIVKCTFDEKLKYRANDDRNHGSATCGFFYYIFLFLWKY